MFGPFERMVALRYLRARRQEGFISVIAGFSLLGIALGVATLIVVSSVMSGFQTEIVGRALGVSGHVTVEAYAACCCPAPPPSLGAFRELCVTPLAACQGPPSFAGRWDLCGAAPER